MIFLKLELEKFCDEVVHVRDEEHASHTVKQASESVDGLKVGCADRYHQSSYFNLKENENSRNTVYLVA